MRNKDFSLLINALKKGDDVFKELYDEIFDVVYYLAYRCVNDEELAKKISQETFVTIYQNINDLKDETTFNIWVDKIIINLCHTYQNSASKMTAINIEANDEELFDENAEFLFDEVLPDDKTSAKLLAEIAKLSFDLRVVILLRYFEEISVMELAQILEISESLVTKRLIIAHKTLKDSLI